MLKRDEASPLPGISEKRANKSRNETVHIAVKNFSNVLSKSHRTQNMIYRFENAYFKTNASLLRVYVLLYFLIEAGLNGWHTRSKLVWCFLHEMILSL